MLIAHIAHAMSISYPHALFILFKYTWIIYIWYIKATCDMNMINNCFCCTICSYRLLSVFWFFKLLLTCIICSYKCTVFNDFWEKVKVEIEVRVALDCLLSVRGVRGQFSSSWQSCQESLFIGLFFSWHLYSKSKEFVCSAIVAPHTTILAQNCRLCSNDHWKHVEFEWLEFQLKWNFTKLNINIDIDFVVIVCEN